MVEIVTPHKPQNTEQDGNRFRGCLISTTLSCNRAGILPSFPTASHHTLRNLAGRNVMWARREWWLRERRETDDFCLSRIWTYMSGMRSSPSHSPLAFNPTLEQSLWLERRSLGNVHEWRFGHTRKPPSQVDWEAFLFRHEDDSKATFLFQEHRAD